MLGISLSNFCKTYTLTRQFSDGEWENWHSAIIRSFHVYSHLFSVTSNIPSKESMDRISKSQQIAPVRFNVTQYS